KEITDQKSQKNKKKTAWLLDWLRNRKEKEEIFVATLVDEAGHKTEISWGERSNKDRRIDISLLSVLYDEDAAALLKGGLQYKWILDKEKKTYLLFASHANTDSMSVEAHYFSNKNQTWLM